MLIVTGTISGCGGSVLLHHFRLVHEGSHSAKYAIDPSLMRRVGDMQEFSQILPEDLIRPTLSWLCMMKSCIVL